MYACAIRCIYAETDELCLGSVETLSASNVWGRVTYLDISTLHVQFQSNKQWSSFVSPISVKKRIQVQQHFMGFRYIARNTKLVTLYEIY